ncbi:hypothetical protein MACH17_03910 [Phaeobacter inhibens]|uniref:hypothetical protein n=1 Tax=Phaeobacter inhibens TaxID=221822 RepID=UPI00276E780A|nr:hypothetical protein [Phaeobacter inhibens]GLO68874.1 hypothetical protein MACH17_03910 [Phaeobacter inhibens]
MSSLSAAGRTYPVEKHCLAPILLVGKGGEGWNCRSLFGVALYRKPKSRIFVLQSTMRCLRVIGPHQETGRIYLSAENQAILDDELQQNFRVTTDELGPKKDDTSVMRWKAQKMAWMRC